MEAVPLSRPRRGVAWLPKLVLSPWGHIQVPKLLTCPLKSKRTAAHEGACFRDFSGKQFSLDLPRVRREQPRVPPKVGFRSARAPMVFPQPAWITSSLPVSRSKEKQYLLFTAQPSCWLASQNCSWVFQGATRDEGHACKL